MVKNRKVYVIWVWILIMLVMISLVKNNSFKTDDLSDNYVAYDKTNMEYLSNIAYNTQLSSVSYDEILNDKDEDGNKISLLINGSKVSFLECVLAPATSQLVYDLNGLDYDLFTAYLGVDASRNTFGNGVKFYVYTSVDGENWDLKSETDVLKSNDNAVYVSVDITNARYLKLEAHDNGDNTSFYAVYGNAKVVKSDYSVNTDFLKSGAYYDELLKNETLDNILNNKEQILLQRSFVDKVGYEQLKILIEYSSDIRNTISWLMNDYDALKLYITGGNPDGDYASSLYVLNDLYTMYKDDLSTNNGKLYKKMMISLALTHSNKVCLWIDGSACSNHLERYKIYKDMYEDNLLENNVFQDLAIEEMRFVMNNLIDDEEIKWLNSYARKYTTNNGLYNLDPYNYITYTIGYDYNKDMYYDINNYSKWDSKYMLSKYNIPYQTGLPKLWIVFEEGAGYEGISKTGSNLNAVFGIPSMVIGQPGHVAYLVYAKDSDNNGLWHIYNDGAGWTKSEKNERMLNSWGSNDWDSYYQVSYILLAQAALNDLDNYEKALEIMTLKDLYKGNLENLYREALKVQNINLDAWDGLIETFKLDGNKKEVDYYNLAEDIALALTYYPLPMWDLLNLVKPYITSSEYTFKFNLLLKNTLERASVATKNESLQYDACKTMASYLLGSNDLEIATFSFDGDNAGSIVLADNLGNVTYEYSLDGKNTWKETNMKVHQLTKEELALINKDDDISIRLVGATDIYTIDIIEGSIPINIYNNDLENKVIGATDKMEWSLDDGKTWVSFEDALPDLTGDKEILVRNMNTGNILASASISLKFTKDKVNDKRSYISIDNLSVYDFSTEEGNQDNYAKYALDGNINTFWHTAWDGSDEEKFITIKLDKKYYLSALEYVPRIDSDNGRITKAQVYVSLDGKTWELVVDGVSWANDSSVKLVSFEAKKAQYVKLVGVETVGSYASASMINLFEDKTKISVPTADVSYSAITLTNQDVVVTLVNPSEEITIVNNEGKNTYTFTENGTFEFIIENSDGVRGCVVARVDYIDKIKPTASLRYDVITPTKVAVKVELINASENIKILNNGGMGSYIFNSNGTFVFEFQDLAGNKNEIEAAVTWINDALDEESSLDNSNSSNTNSNNSNANSSNSVNNSSTNNNSSDTSNDEVEEENEAQENDETTEYEMYKRDNIVVRFYHSYKEEFTLVKKDLELDPNIAKQLSGKKEYFELYLLNESNSKVVSGEKIIKVEIEIGNNNLAGIYLMDYIKPLAIDFTKENNVVTFETSALGKYLLVYEDDNTKEEKKSFFSRKVLIPSVIVVIGIVISFQHFKRKNN